MFNLISHIAFKLPAERADGGVVGTPESYRALRTNYFWFDIFLFTIVKAVQVLSLFLPLVLGYYSVNYFTAAIRNKSGRAKNFGLSILSALSLISILDFVTFFGMVPEFIISISILFSIYILWSGAKNLYLKIKSKKGQSKLLLRLFFILHLLFIFYLLAIITYSLQDFLYYNY